MKLPSAVPALPEFSRPVSPSKVRWISGSRSGTAQPLRSSQRSYERRGSAVDWCRSVRTDSIAAMSSSCFASDSGVWSVSAGVGVAFVKWEPLKPSFAA